MVEKIEIQKGFTPISSTAKVRNVKKQNSNLQHRRFNRELQEEENKKKGKDNDVFDDQEIVNENLVEEQIEQSESTEENETNIKSRTGEKGNIQGNLIDIIV